MALSSREECEEFKGKWRDGVCVLEPYLRYLEKVEGLERELKNLPDVSLLGTQYFPLMLSRPICIMKELLKGATTLRLHILPVNEHISEEIGLIEKDQEHLGSDLKQMRLRREKIIVT